MTEIESRYYDKIELLKALNVDIWLKKPNFPIIKKKIIIQTLLFEKHKGIIESFIKLCSKKRGEVKAELISSKELSNDQVSKIKNELAENLSKKIKLDYKYDKSLIVCQKEVMNEMIAKNLKKSDNVYVNDTKDMIFVFNTLFESDKISNDMKKSVWKDLIYSLSYE